MWITVRKNYYCKHKNDRKVRFCRIIRDSGKKVMSTTWAEKNPHVFAAMDVHKHVDNVDNCVKHR